MKFKILCAIALIATLSACGPEGGPRPTPGRSGPQQGTQPGGNPPLQHEWGMGGCTDPNGGPLSARCRDKLRTLPACRHEDGNPDGQPCLWTDPSSGGGDVFYVDSGEYRN